MSRETLRSAARRHDVTPEWMCQILAREGLYQRSRAQSGRGGVRVDPAAVDAVMAARRRHLRTPRCWTCWSMAEITCGRVTTCRWCREAREGVAT